MAKQRTTKPDYAAILSIIVGILIIIWPDALAIAVGIYLIITGILRLMDR